MSKLVSAWTWVAAALLVAAPAVHGDQIKLPGFPGNPTSVDQCEAPAREWAAISKQVNDRHSACLKSPACRSGSSQGYRGVCSCGACHELHVLMDRFSSGDLGQHRRNEEKRCRQTVMHHERERARQHAAFQESQRRAAAAQADARRQQEAWQAEQARHQQAEASRQQALMAQQQREAMERQQAMIAQQRAADEQAARSQAALREALAGMSPPKPAAPVAPSYRAPTPAAPAPAPQPAPPPGAALNDLSSINRDLSQHTTPPQPAARSVLENARRSFEEANEGYERLMDRSLRIGDVEMRVGELKDTAVSLVTTYLASIEVKSVLRAVLRAPAQVRSNPVLELAQPFLDVENARNIDAAVRAARRQAETGTTNENQARQLRQLMAEMEREERGR